MERYEGGASSPPLLSLISLAARPTGPVQTHEPSKRAMVVCTNAARLFAPKLAGCAPETPAGVVATRAGPGRSFMRPLASGRPVQ